MKPVGTALALRLQVSNASDEEVLFSPAGSALRARSFFCLSKRPTVWTA